MENKSNNISYKQKAEMAARREKDGDFAQAARFYRLAGEEAAAQYDNEAAIAYFTEALNRTSDFQVGERFTLILSRQKVYEIQGNHHAIEEDLASLDYLANVLNNDAKRAEASVRRANQQMQMGQYDLAISIAQTAVRLAHLGGSGQVEAEAYLTWGMALTRKGSYDWAQTQLVQALTLAQATSDKQLEANCIRVIGLLYNNQGDMVQSRFSFDQALVIYEEIGDRRNQAMVLNNLGHIAYNRKKYHDAETYWNNALAEYESIGDRPGLAMVSGNLGALHLDVGEYKDAQRDLENSLAISREVQSKMGETMALVNLALLNHYQSEPAKAYDYSKIAVRYSKQMKHRRVEGYGLIPMGHALLGLDKPVEAKEAYWQSLTIWHELGQGALEMEMRAGLARCELAQNNHDAALEQVDLVLSYLERDDALEGVESAPGIYLACYEVLQAAGNGRAEKVLKQGHRALQIAADEISDKAKRKSYLENVPVNRQIMEAVSGE